MSDSLRLFRQEHLPAVESAMLTFLTEETTEGALLEAMAYSIHAGGKRLRPLLLLATLAYFGQEIQTGDYQVAAALEMVHTYSLIHDDLPAMDNDDLRRGKPTNHKVFGEAQAILAGDGLLTEAFHLLGESQITDRQKLRLLPLLAKAAGSYGMVAGQVADIQGEQQQLTLEELQSVHSRKTGALIEFAVVAGTILADQSDAVCQQMAEFAQHFGIAFQIKDDLLDVLGDEQVIGKRTGMDQQLNKSTYPSLLGNAGAQKALDEQCQAARSSLSGLNGPGKNYLLALLEKTNRVR